MELYLLCKWVHVGSAATSFTLFLLRGGWALYRPELIYKPLVRVLPHVVDTILLASALMLLLLAEPSPFAAGWLGAKLAALPLYIVPGYVALHDPYSRRVRIAAGLVAVVVFVYIVAVARTRSPAPWLV